MKRKIALILILVLVSSLLAACNENEAIENPDNEENEGLEDTKDPDEKKEDSDTSDNQEENPSNQEDTEPIETMYLSVFMTKKDIVESLGDNYEVTTEEEYGGVSFYSILEYDGITFYYTHESEELPDDAIADLIEVTSNKYSYEFDLNIGGDFVEALEYCQNNFENTFDVHTGKEIFNIFNYEETDMDGQSIETGYVLRLEYESEDYYETQEEVPSDLKLAKIALFVPLD